MSDVTVNDLSGRVSITWDAEDAIEVAYVIQLAGLDRDGSVRDRGLYEDSLALFAAADDWLLRHKKSYRSASDPEPTPKETP